MARRRASMREGPLAELFKATEAAQRQAERERVGQEAAEAPVEGSSVLKYDSSGPAAKAYRDLAKEVLNGATPREHA